jgi:GNAT superfamily N-acetyltransferase
LSAPAVTVRRLGPAEAAAAAPALADVLIDCVEGGASVSFLLPMTPDKATAFWRGVAGAVARGERALLVAEDGDGQIFGTVQLILDLPENQPHRAEVAKLLVVRRARRRGVAALLMAAVETAARGEGRRLLVLDTASGEAERLYARMGWQRVGLIPDYALLPDGAPCATTFYFKSLDSPR